jgi:hypothetical protein
LTYSGKTLSLGTTDSEGMLLIDLPMVLRPEFLTLPDSQPLMARIQDQEACVIPTKNYRRWAVAAAEKERLAGENKQIMLLVSQRRTAACLAWLEQNIHILGPNHERVDELDDCAADELMRRAGEALMAGDYEECQGYLERMTEMGLTHPGLEGMLETLKTAPKENTEYGKVQLGNGLELDLHKPPIELPPEDTLD